MKIQAKNLILLSALLGIIIFLFLEKLDISRNCLYGLIDSECNIPLYLLESVLLICFPVFFFAFLSYFFKSSVAHAWRNFTYWFFGFLVLVILFLPEPSGGGGWISGGSPTKATYGLLLSALYFVISLILIIKKAIAERAR